ncbi:M23 family metallopeptidase [Variovorax sp. J22P240]|uniref:M23 family metallopeptidase n=1 Tax=Variovorax sp. J22P240 TaxID=3053514 RepID=UPI0025758F74|nr:M23 family metallopeptidase [Variovorax sp. J22P240]MDL9997949.1 M23 family metallopeptidase [Variovorax sp. J22P240]
MNTKPSTSKKAAKSASRAKPADPQPAAVAKADRNFLRPVSGAVVARFDGRGNKGVDFAGSKGDPVHAARDGKVVYSAVGPRGYGQLIMIKHDAAYVTAYAHNSQLLVKEGQSVKRGQMIARMGDTEASRVKLHFELRKNGNAVDPVLYLELADASAASPERDQRNEQ